MSFRLKTILGIAIIEIVLLASLIFSGLAILKQTNEEQLQRRVKEVASLFQSASRDAIITTDVATLQDLVRNLLNNHDVLYVRIHGANGNVLAQDGIPDLLDRPFKEDVLINYVDDNIFDSRTDVIVSGEKFGEIEFGMPTNFISQTVDSAGYKATFIAVVELSLSALFSLLLGTYLTRQLRHLANASRQVAKGEFNVTVPVAGKDELATTSLAFNRMSEELGKLYRNLETKVQERATQFNRSEVRARTILMNIGEGLITTDKLGKIISYNRAAVQMFGWPETGMEEKLIDPYISITDIDSVSQSAMDLQSEKTGSHRNQVVAKNESGKPFFIELLSTWLLLDEKLTRIVLVEDITERLKSAESLKMAQESLVESAHKAGMAEFSTGVLHNIGNLLNSVALSGERMQTALDDNLHHGVKKLRNFLEDEAQDVTVAIKNAEKGSLFIDYIKRLEEEISQERDEIGQELSALKQKLSMMKDIIRTQQNYMRVASFIENFAMIELLEDCVKIEGESLHSRGIILSVECDKHLRVSAVRSKVLQILTNIIKNAKDAVAANKYLNKNSVIHIVCSKQDDGNATIRITDNGVGIEKENLEAIFQYGYSDKENGHGFGLNVSVMTAREMGGNIIAYSEGPGRGATFVLTLPLSDAAGDKKVS